MKTLAPLLLGIARIAATLSALGSTAHAQEMLDWRLMIVADLRLPGSWLGTYASLWRDEIIANNQHYTFAGDFRFAVGNATATEAHVVVRSRDNTKQAIVSVLNTHKGCAIVATDEDGTTIKRCPAKVALFQSGEVEINEIGLACFVEHAPNADTTSNAAVAAFDPQTSSIRLAAIFQGEITNACLVNIPLPRPLEPNPDHNDDAVASGRKE